MKKHVKKFVTHPLIKGSTILLIGGNIASLLLFIFNLILPRFLTPSDYGVYATLVSFLALFGIFPSAFTSSFTKFAAVYSAQKDEEKMRTLFVVGNKIVGVFAAVLFFILIIFIFQISHFLRMPDLILLILIFLSLALSIITSLPLGVLTGEMRLFTLSFVNIVTPFFKIIVGILLLSFGLKVFGVITATFLSSLLTFCYLVFLFRKHIIRGSIRILEQKEFISAFKKYAFHFFLSTVGITILTSSDMLFVKHFFSAKESGLYAALAIMGRAIFWLTAPMYSVFFPLIAQKKEKKENYHSTLFLAMGIITMASVSLSFIYFLFPGFIITFFHYPSDYLVLTSYLGLFSLYVIIFSVAMLFNNFLLAIGKSEIYKINLIVAAIFILLFYLFHNSFYQVIGILFFTSLLLLSLHLLYYNVSRHERT